MEKNQTIDKLVAKLSAVKTVIIDDGFTLDHDGNSVFYPLPGKKLDVPDTTKRSSAAKELMQIYMSNDGSIRQYILDVLLAKDPCRNEDQTKLLEEIAVVDPVQSKRILDKLKEEKKEMYEVGIILGIGAITTIYVLYKTTVFAFNHIIRPLGEKFGEYVTLTIHKALGVD